MAFAETTIDPVWLDRIKQPIIRPALFLYLDWPTGEVRATTHYKTVTTFDQSVSPNVSAAWSGVGNLAFVESPEFRSGGALVTYRVGLSSIPQGSADLDTEALAIGRRAYLYLGLFNASWQDPVLHRIFTGRVISAGDFSIRHVDDGQWVVDASIEISNGRNPRRAIANHHSPETAVAGDTGWSRLPTVAKGIIWPK